MRWPPKQQVRQHLSLTLGSLPERQALEYAAKRPQGLGLALSLVTADSSASVLDAVVRGRSLVLDEMAMRRRAVNDEAVGPAASLWTTLRQARERLANLVIRGPGSLRPEQYAALVAQAQQEKENAERALGAQSAAFRSEVSRSAIGLDEIQEAPAGGQRAGVRRSIRPPGVRSGATERNAPADASRGVLCRIRAAIRRPRPHRRAAWRGRPNRCRSCALAARNDRRNGIRIERRAA